MEDSQIDSQKEQGNEKLAAAEVKYVRCRMDHRVAEELQIVATEEAEIRLTWTSWPVELMNRILLLGLGFMVLTNASLGPNHGG